MRVTLAFNGLSHLMGSVKTVFREPLDMESPTGFSQALLKQHFPTFHYKTRMKKEQTVFHRFVHIVIAIINILFYK